MISAHQQRQFRIRTPTARRVRSSARICRQQADEIFSFASIYFEKCEYSAFDTLAAALPWQANFFRQLRAQWIFRLSPATIALTAAESIRRPATVNVDGNSGPFDVTAPNTDVSWSSGNSSQTITWNVANTTAAPVNATNVRISLSTDGGQTFPIILRGSDSKWRIRETVSIPFNIQSTSRTNQSWSGRKHFLRHFRR